MQDEPGPIQLHFDAEFDPAPRNYAESGVPSLESNSSVRLADPISSSNFGDTPDILTFTTTNVKDRAMNGRRKRNCDQMVQPILRRRVRRRTVAIVFGIRPERCGARRRTGTKKWEEGGESTLVDDMT